MSYCVQEASWQSLPPHIVKDQIVSCLWADKDQESLIALMQTSRMLREIVSHDIKAVSVDHRTDSMHLFPRHAFIQSLNLSLSVIEAVTWLRNFVASGPDTANCLLQLASLQLDFKHIDEQLNLKGFTTLLRAVSQLCPNVGCLHVYFNVHSRVNLNLLQSLGRCLPHLMELLLDNANIPDASMDEWSSCFPPQLAKLSLPRSTLPRKLIRHLMSMPTLVEVEAKAVDDCPDPGEPPINTETCAWKVLR